MFYKSFIESLTYIFKEKNWVSKVGFFLFIVTLQILVSASFSFLGYEEYNTTTGDVRMSILFLPAFCVAIVVFIVSAVSLMFYQYENIQAAIQNRETNAIWSYDLWDTIKKLGKYFLASFALVIPFIVFFIFAIFLGFLVMGLTAIGGPLVILGVMLFCGLMLLLIPIGVYYVYFFMVPSLLRLIATNTFSEALKISENFDLGRKYWRHFGVLFLMALLVGIAFGIPIGLIGAVSDIIFDGDQRLSSLLEGILSLPLTLILQLFIAFCYPYLTGKVFKDVLDGENISYAK